MGHSLNHPDRQRDRKRALKVLSVSLALSFSSVSYGAFELRNSKPEQVNEPAPVFDQSEYEVWVDHTYKAVVVYGVPGKLAAAPSYGDPMPLEDALKLLVPTDWKVMKSRELTKQGRIEVQWDVESANWVDVLRNLGEREGLRFHVDFTKKEIFVQNGRKLLFDRAIAKRGQQPLEQPALKPDTSNSTTIQSGESQKSTVTFTVDQGEDAKAMMTDLATLLGYRKPHWLLGNQTIEQRMTWDGGPMEVLSSAARSVGGRVCLYSDQNIAFVAKSMRCPR